MCGVISKGSDYSTHSIYRPSSSSRCIAHILSRAVNRVVFQAKNDGSHSMLDGMGENFPNLKIKVRFSRVNKTTADVVNHPAHYPRVTTPAAEYTVHRVRKCVVCCC